MFSGGGAGLGAGGPTGVVALAESASKPVKLRAVAATPAAKVVVRRMGRPLDGVLWPLTLVNRDDSPQDFGP
jgi:hypothetical protein